MATRMAADVTSVRRMCARCARTHKTAIFTVIKTALFIYFFFGLHFCVLCRESVGALPRGEEVAACGGLQAAHGATAPRGASPPRPGRVGRIQMSGSRADHRLTTAGRGPKLAHCLPPLIALAGRRDGGPFLNREQRPVSGTRRRPKKPPLGWSTFAFSRVVSTDHVCAIRLTRFCWQSSVNFEPLDTLHSKATTFKPSWYIKSSLPTSNFT